MVTERDVCRIQPQRPAQVGPIRFIATANRCNATTRDESSDVCLGRGCCDRQVRILVIGTGLEEHRSNGELGRRQLM